MNCSACNHEFATGGKSSQAFSRDGLVVTVTGIPAEAVCPHCGNAILAWEVAEQVEALVAPLFDPKNRPALSEPVVTIAFPESAAL
jgi:YgiT-type zinc finger domain-containing protein